MKRLYINKSNLDNAFPSNDPRVSRIQDTVPHRSTVRRILWAEF